MNQVRVVAVYFFPQYLEEGVAVPTNLNREWTLPLIAEFLEIPCSYVMSLTPPPGTGSVIWSQGFRFDLVNFGPDLGAEFSHQS